MKEYEFLWLNIILFHWLIGVFIYRDREYQKKKRVWEWAGEEIRTLVFREIQFVYTWDIQTCKVGNWICGPGTQSRGRHGWVIYLSVAIEPEWMSLPGETTQWTGEQSLRLSFRCPTVSGCEEEDGPGSGGVAREEGRNPSGARVTGAKGWGYFQNEGVPSSPDCYWEAR